jgi:DnaK suppressor protein
MVRRNFEFWQEEKNMARPTARRPARYSKMQNRKYPLLRIRLMAQKQELVSRIAERLERVVSVREPDDDVAVAIENYTKDLTAASLERERSTLTAIEAALTRLSAGEYGSCEVCGVAISRARLEALPWAHLCVNCAERSAARVGI